MGERVVGRCWGKANRGEGGKGREKPKRGCGLGRGEDREKGGGEMGEGAEK